MVSILLPFLLPWLFPDLILLEKVLKDLMKKMQKQQALADPTPAEVERQKKSLLEIFKDHKLDAEKHKSFFDAILEWKRHL